jgi:hypothetical protein
MKFSKAEIAGNTAVIVKMPADHTQHNIQITCIAGGNRSVPNAGALKVEIRQPMASAFEELSNSPITLSDAANWLAFLSNVVAEEIRFTVSSIEAGHDTRVAIASHKSGRGF